MQDFQSKREREKEEEESQVIKEMQRNQEMNLCC